MKYDYPVSFERRRYGNKTYTWVYAMIDNEWVSLGDPWPKINPSRAEVLREIERIINDRVALLV